MKKKVSKKKNADPRPPPMFEELILAAAVSDYRRIREETLAEIKSVRGSVLCKKCGKKIKRAALEDYYCPHCPGVSYVDETTGLPVRANAGTVLLPEQINRLTAAWQRVLTAKARLSRAQQQPEA